MPLKLDTLSSRIRALIGKRFLHCGEACTVVEVLADGNALVLRGVPRSNRIQRDQFGRPTRRTGKTWEIPIFSDGGEELSAELLDLLANKLAG